MAERLIRNSLVCLKCMQEIVSGHRHAFISCRGQHVWVDGGNDYLRRVGDFKNAIDTSLYDDNIGRYEVHTRGGFTAYYTWGEAKDFVEKNNLIDFTLEFHTVSPVLSKPSNW